MRTLMQRPPTDAAVRHARSGPAPLGSGSALLRLQRAVGNRALQRALLGEDDELVQTSRRAHREGARRQVSTPSTVSSGGPAKLQRDTPERDVPKGKSWTGAAKECGTDFCTPLSSEMNAHVRRTKFWPALKSAIGIAVSHRVVPVWNTWAMGGSSLQDFTGDFGADFTASPTTTTTTNFLVRSIKSKLTSSPPAIPSAGSVKLDIPMLIPAEVKAIDTPGDAHEMNFDIPGDIPGNLAGGIGKDQAANPVGKTPSPQDDQRIARGEVKVTDSGPSFIIKIDLNYTVKDTVDLCPGNCGSRREQVATIQMSRWEATGISGDVPYTVDFPAPFVLTPPFAIPKPAPPAPAPGPAPTP